MLPIVLIGFSLLLGLFELWWAAAFIHAYRQLREPVLLVQAGAGLAYVLFLLVVLAAILANQPLNRFMPLGLLAAILLASFLWRRMGGRELMAQRYPRRWRDVLAFRRPAVDLKRRIRTR
jgi:hypothetical protein